MKKKKIVALLVASVMTIGVVGGTLAWFTSNDSVTNVFNTGTTTEDRLDAGIDVWEKFYKDGEEETSPTTETEVKYDNPVLPGDKFVKEIWVQSTADYDQFLRAKLVKNFYIVEEVTEGEETKNVEKLVTHYAIADDGTVTYGTTGDNAHKLDLGLIELNVDNLGREGNTWFQSEDGYYYYNQILQEKGYNEEQDKPETDVTSNLLKNVTLSKDAGNVYKNLTFKVELKAESVQASNGAAGDLGWDATVPAASITGYKTQTENN